MGRSIRCIPRPPPLLACPPEGREEEKEEASGPGLEWVDTRGPTRLPARAGFFNLKNSGGFFKVFSCFLLL